MTVQTGCSLQRYQRAPEMSSDGEADGKQEMPLPTAICGGATLAPHQQKQRYGLCAALSCAVLLCAWLTGLHDPVLELAYAARGAAADHHASGGGGGGMATGWRVVRGEAPVPSAIARAQSRRPVDEALLAVLSEPEPDTGGDSDGAPTMPPPPPTATPPPPPAMPPPPPCNDSAGSPPTAAALALPVAPELQPPGFFDGIGRWVWHDAAQIPRRCPPAQNGECGWTWEDASTGEVWEEDAQHRLGRWEAFNQVGSAVADPSHCP
eukprot:COSAG01_NODE_6460_length_3656_cov_5.809952_2_plen_265_part_00